MRPKSSFSSDGFAQEVLPLIKDGLVVFRSILDTLIDRIEEAEKERDSDVRRDIYSSIIDVLKAEMKDLEQGESDATTSRAKVQASRAKIEVIEAIISALMKESEQLEKESRKKKKKTRRARKVKID